MNRRFLALLLVVCVALQSLAPALAGAQPDTAPAAAHCGEAMQPADHEDGLHGDSPSCPHCDDHSGKPDAGCASHCSSAVAVLPGTFAIAPAPGTTRFDAITPPAPTRFDIPPTPPPIA